MAEIEFWDLGLRIPFSALGFSRALAATSTQNRKIWHVLSTRKMQGALLLIFRGFLAYHTTLEYFCKLPNTPHFSTFFRRMFVLWWWEGLYPILSAQVGLSIQTLHRFLGYPSSCALCNQDVKDLGRYGSKVFLSFACCRKTWNFSFLARRTNPLSWVSSQVDWFRGAWFWRETPWVHDNGSLDLSQWESKMGSFLNSSFRLSKRWCK